MATRDHQSVARAQWIGVRNAVARSLLALSSTSDPFAKWAPIGLHRLEVRTALGLDVERSGKIVAWPVTTRRTMDPMLASLSGSWR